MLQYAVYIPWIAALGALLCGLLCLKPALKHWAGAICVVSMLAGFVLAVGAYVSPQFKDSDNHIVHAPWQDIESEKQPENAHEETGDASDHAEHHAADPVIIQTQPWIYAGGTGNDDGTYSDGLQINYGYYFDGLTMIMLLVITGIGSLIAIYATGYMKGDPGVARFFASMALFIFAMTTLVMADNLVLLFLGWEGVGLCSYLLIGYYYGKPTAVAAAKKAFIVNRIGDFAFLVGIFLCYQHFGSTDFATIFNDPRIAEAGTALPFAIKAIPFCLMIGAFGKSAQIPLFVWLPDAMAGPTPVSALVHAATMVTAGVYLIARMMPVFTHVPEALTVVAVVGGVTALFAGTIALCNNDLKGVFAYSTVSQLGYMFLGLGAASTVGAISHLATHAFFKALLFLTAGSVMHALAGTLDIRKMGGMGRYMPVTKWLMLVGCIALAGVPFISAGFYSKDEIIAATWIKALEGGGGGLFILLGILSLLTALLTAFYTFRLWFIVFTGEPKYEMGDEHHSEDESQDNHHAHEPHEMPWWPMNLPLVVLAVGSVVSGFILVKKHVVEDLLAASSAALPISHTATAHTMHILMMVLSSILAIAGIFFAYVFYSNNAKRAEAAANLFKGPVALLRGKYFIDELFDKVIVRPLFITGQVLYIIDQLVIHATIMSVGWAPRLIGKSVKPSQTGQLQGYGLGMVAGVAAIALLLLFLL